MIDSDIHVFDQPQTTLWENTSRGGQRGHFWYAGENPDNIRPTSSLARSRFAVDVPIYFYTGGIDSSKVKITVFDGDKKFTKNLKVNSGVSKFLWNREFDLIPYTEFEEELISKAFMKLDTTSNRVKRILKQYSKAGDTIKIKRNLIQSYINILGLDKYLGILKAEPKSYRITVQRGDQEKEGVLHIRKDPILKED